MNIQQISYQKLTRQKQKQTNFLIVKPNIIEDNGSYCGNCVYFTVIIKINVNI